MLVHGNHETWSNRSLVHSRHPLDFIHSCPCLSRLTAYVVKIFSLADDLIYIEKKVICQAIDWLVTRRKDSHGMFYEVSEVSSSSMGVSDHSWPFEVMVRTWCACLIFFLKRNQRCKHILQIFGFCRMKMVTCGMSGTTPKQFIKRFIMINNENACVFNIILRCGKSGV